MSVCLCVCVYVCVRVCEYDVIYLSCSRSLSFLFRNPFVLGSELCGPALCAKFSCCLLCVAFIVLMIFCQPFLNIMINIIFIVC